MLVQSEGTAATLSNPTIDSELPLTFLRLFLLWLLAGGAMLFLLGTPPVRRTQEARVLETARQMMDAPLNGWLLPRLNGQPRLKKPPLTYWMTAGMYKLLGVSEAAGRFPSVLSGWLTLGLTYAAARRLFRDQQTALLCSACLLESYLFFRYNRLAETDSPATLFVTLSVYAMLRAFNFPSRGGAKGEARSTALLWMAVAGFGIGGAVMAKGAPAALPLLFLIAMAIITRRVRPLGWFFLTGVPTAAIVGGAWYLYVYQRGYFPVLLNEIRNNAEGGDHGKPFYFYLPMLFTGVAPWTAIWVVAVATFTRGARNDRATAVVLAWAGALVIPLFFIGNKQFHYLLPAMPAFAIMIGSIVSRAMLPPTSGSSDQTVPRALIGWTIALTLLVAIATPLAGRMIRKQVLPIDLLIAGTALTAACVIVIAWRRNRMLLAVGTYAFTVTIGISLLDAKWLLTIQPANPRIVARYVSEHVGAGPYFFYGGNVSLPLCFNLRTPIPTVNTEQLVEAAMRNPQSIVIVVSKDGKSPAVPPADLFVTAADPLTDGEQAYNFYRFAPAPPAAPQ